MEQISQSQAVVVKYNTCNGDVIDASTEPKYNGNWVVIQVTEEVADILFTTKRRKANEERNKRRRYQMQGYYEVSIYGLNERLNNDGEHWKIDIPDYNSDIHLSFERREQIIVVRKAVATLSDEKQKLVRAVEYSNVPVKLYAEQKGLSFQAVYKQRNKVRTELKAILTPLVE